MAELKTKPTTVSVDDFLDAIPDPARRADCIVIARLMKRLTRAEPKMWGPSIVGFGDYHYKYASGREGDWFPVGFAPRKSDLTLYFAGGLDPTLLAKLGKHKTGVGCLYISKLENVDQKVLAELISGSLRRLKAIIAERKAAERS